jgi:hypothetical protein
LQRITHLDAEAPWRQFFRVAHHLMVQPCCALGAYLLFDRQVLTQFDSAPCGSLRIVRLRA